MSQLWVREGEGEGTEEEGGWGTEGESLLSYIRTSFHQFCLIGRGVGAGGEG